MSVAYLSDDIIANDVMTHMTRLELVYVYKGHWEDVYSPVPTLSLVPYRLVLRSTITVVGFPLYCSSELPLQAERATPYLSTIVASEDLLNTIRHWTWT